MDFSYFLGKFRSEFVHADFGAVLCGDNNRVDSLWDAGTAIEGVLDCHLQRIAINSEDLVWPIALSTHLRLRVRTHPVESAISA